jgi:hypothetical protein
MMGQEASVIEIVTEEAALPQPSLAITVSVTCPDAPAWNVIESPLAGDVRVPPVTCHWCVIPDLGFT